MEVLKIGLRHTSHMKVDTIHSALALQSGDLEVAGTPAMLALMENAAMLAVAPCLDKDYTTVGGHIESSHLRPTKIGGEIEATAVLKKIEGKKLYFDVEAREGDVLIGKGHHLRFIVHRQKFLSNVSK